MITEEYFNALISKLYPSDFFSADAVHVAEKRRITEKLKLLCQHMEERYPAIRLHMSANIGSLWLTVTEFCSTYQTTYCVELKVLEAYAVRSILKGLERAVKAQKLMNSESEIVPEQGECIYDDSWTYLTSIWCNVAKVVDQRIADWIVLGDDSLMYYIKRVKNHWSAVDVAEKPPKPGIDKVVTFEDRAKPKVYK